MILANTLPIFFMDTQACNAEPTEFESMNLAQAKSLNNYSRLKTCNLDPPPASIIKDCMDLLLPLLTKMINTSLQTATCAAMPKQLKEAMIRSKLEKRLS